MQSIASVRKQRPAPVGTATRADEWIGVVGADACAELERFGAAVSWHDVGVALSGPVATSPCGNVVVCGDVLLDNAWELARELETPCANDAALLAALFRVHGIGAIRRARGMFAVAVWDTRERRLTLLRDAVGARNIYYTRGRTAWFSPKLKTLRCSPAVSGGLSLPALRNYLTCGYVPGADTMWQDAFEVRPGSAVRLPEGDAESVWRPEETPYDRDETLDASAARLRPLLEDAVRICLPSAGPVGVFLSGGLDSSLVTALAARLHAGPVHTYAIHFGEQYRNELEFSSMVAAHCRTQHHVIELTGSQIRENIVESIAALDDPIGDPLTTPNLILGRMAARDCSVILNGEGGDPCFGGPKNLPMMLHEVYSGAMRETAYLRAYQKCYDDLPRLLTLETQTQLVKCEPQEAAFTPYFGPESGMNSYLNRLMLTNTLLKGADNILTKVNNLTSANNLIGRSPLFDRRIVEVSFAIPPEHKLAAGVEKAILKRAVADLLPEPILTRPKSGMLVPVQGWFRKDLKRMARGLLLSRSARIRPYLSQELIREWMAYRGSIWPRHGIKLWLVLTLEIWLRENE
jgi:asparagine synthase (glutamine-hydrolysing)